MNDITENNKIIDQYLNNSEKTYSICDNNDESFTTFDTGLSYENALSNQSYYDERYYIDSEIIPDQLDYHNNWNSLLKVVDKLEEELNTSIIIEKNKCYVSNNIVNSVRKETRREAVYSMVLKLIKYN